MEGPETEAKKTNFGQVLKGLLLGGLAGALAGLIFAPKAGRELRADLKVKGNEAKKIYDESLVKARAIVDDAKNRAAELIKEADRQLSEARSKAKDIIKRQETTPTSPPKDEPSA